MIPFSILDLAPIRQGGDAAQAFGMIRDQARHAEKLGYHRYWMAEHHNMGGIGSAATSVLIGHVAGATKTMRVGAGGIMLPNHAPLIIAEQFGTLESLYPGRIDLGLGRAPGTDQVTAHALRRQRMGTDHEFPQDVVELQSYFRAAEPHQAVRAVPGAGTTGADLATGFQSIQCAAGGAARTALRLCLPFCPRPADGCAACLPHWLPPVGTAGSSLCDGRYQCGRGGYRRRGPPPLHLATDAVHRHDAGQAEPNGSAHRRHRQVLECAGEARRRAQTEILLCRLGSNGGSRTGRSHRPDRCRRNHDNGADLRSGRLSTVA